MHLYSGILPTLNVRCEIESNNKKHCFFSPYFSNEESVQTSDGEVLVFIRSKKISSFPGPWIIAATPDDPDRAEWLALLNQKVCQEKEKVEQAI